MEVSCAPLRADLPYAVVVAMVRTRRVGQTRSRSCSARLALVYQAFTLVVDSWTD